MNCLLVVCVCVCVGVFFIFKDHFSLLLDHINLQMLTIRTTEGGVVQHAIWKLVDKIWTKTDKYNL